MFTKRIYRLILVIVLAVFVLPLSSSFSVGAQAKKIIKYQALFDPETIDPQLGSFPDGVAYDHALFATLLRYDLNNKPQPWIATDVATTANGGISADGKTYTYHLRKWPWSDGKGVVTAQDVVYAWQRVVNPALAGGYGSFFNGLLLNADTINNTAPSQVNQALLDTLGVKAIDASTVQFTLVHPAGYWNDIMCMWLDAPVRKDNVERNGPDGKPLDPASGAWTDPANGPLVGTGPFILSKLDHDKEWIFTRNLNYAGAAPKLDEIDLEVIQDANVALIVFKRGQLDVLLAPPPIELNSIKADPVLSKQLLLYPIACSYYLGMDNTKPPFDNIDVRKAFALAFDRDTYNQVISEGLAEKWLSFLPPAVQGADPKLGSAYDYNPSQAKAELAKAGYPNGQGFPTIKYHFIAVGTGPQRIAEWIQAQYKKVLNINIIEDPMDKAAGAAAYADPKIKPDGLWSLGWCADYLHPSDWLIPVFGANLPAGNSNDTSGFYDANFEKIAIQADNELDPAKALALYQQAQQILVDDVPVVFLYTTLVDPMVNPRVTNLPHSGFDGGDPGWFFIEDVDVATN